MRKQQESFCVSRELLGFLIPSPSWICSWAGRNVLQMRLKQGQVPKQNHCVLERIFKPSLSHLCFQDSSTSKTGSSLKIRCGTHTHTHTHLHTGILLSHKKEWNNAICSNMDGPKHCHTEWSQLDRERQTSYDTTYIWNLKDMIQTNLFIKQQTHRLRERT